MVLWVRERKEKSESFHVEAGMCLIVLLVGRPVEGVETQTEVADNEEAVGERQHQGVNYSHHGQLQVVGGFGVRGVHGLDSRAVS